MVDYPSFDSKLEVVSVAVAVSARALVEDSVVVVAEVVLEDVFWHLHLLQWLQLTC